MSDDAYSTQLLCQIRVLLRYVSARPELSLANLTIEGKNLPQSPMTAGDIIVSLDGIEAKLAKEPRTRLDAKDLVVLQFTRDKLSELVKPATGLTVAYTSMVTEASWSAHAMFDLSKNAYPHLKGRARIHRWSRNVLVLLALSLTITAVWLSTEVAVGKHLLQSMDALRVRQASIADDEKLLETKLDKSADTSIPLVSVVDKAAQTVNLAALGICDRWRAYAGYAHKNGINSSSLVGDGGSQDDVKLTGSPDERVVCGKDNVLKHDFIVVRTEINLWLTNWPEIVGGVFVFPEELRALLWGPNPSTTDKSQSTDNTELQVAPKILAIGNYLLPVCFGMLGSLIYVLLEFWSKVQVSQLEPRDSWLSWIRLVLGLVVGTVIGLFFTSYGPIQAQQPTAGAGSDLLSSLTLSASGLAFLAGFGVEGVFNALQDLVQRVFPVKAER